MPLVLYMMSFVRLASARHLKNCSQVQPFWIFLVFPWDRAVSLVGWATGVWRILSVLAVGVCCLGCWIDAEDHLGHSADTGERISDLRGGIRWVVHSGPPWPSSYLDLLAGAAVRKEGNRRI